jgi:hypothetical protein
MSSTISFKKQKLNDKSVEIKRIGALVGVLKYVLSKDIPATEEKSVLLVTTDTTELFVGGGLGNPLKKVSDIIVVADVGALPETGLKDKLYVSTADKAIYFWDENGFQQLGASGGSGGTIQTKIFEYDKAADFPATGQSKSIYITKDADYMYRFDVGANKYVQLARQSTDPTIAARFAAIDSAVLAKAEKTDLGGYRQKTDKVTESDLDVSTAAKLNQNLSPYDDRALKTRISGVELNKADKTQLINYRQKTDKVAQADLDLDLSGKIDSIPAPYNDTQVKTDLAALQNNKADKTALSVFRKTADSIQETDLDSSVIAKLNKPAYDDTLVIQEITNLDNDKLDKVDAANAYRKKSDVIKESDLDPAVALKLNLAAIGYDDSVLKSRVSTVESEKTDKTYAETTYLKKTDKIAESQLDPAFAGKVSTLQTQVANKADQSTVAGIQASVTGLTSNVNTLQTAVASKADGSTVANLQSNVNTLQSDINKTANHLATVEVGLSNVESKLSQKADASDLANYRSIDSKITATDLDTAVNSTINKVPTMEQTITTLLARVAALENVATSKNILSLATITPLNVAYGTLFSSLLLPNKVTATLSDSTSASLSVAWNSATYNANTAGIYTIDGVLTLPSYVTNTNNLKPTVQVTVAAAPAASGWSYEFKLTQPTMTSITLNDIHTGLRFTDDEFYTDGAVKVYYIGTEPTRQYAANPKYVPNSTEVPGITTPTPDGYIDFDSTLDDTKGGTLYFSGGSLGTRVYKVVKA